MYKWLYQWFLDNKDSLDIREWSGIFWEWIWMWKISYPDLDKKFYVFAKANISEELEISNLYYDRKLFIYPFESQILPTCFGLVDKLEYNWPTDKESLDKFYEEYKKEKKREVEWFIINTDNSIRKYIRMKNWELSEHHAHWE